MQRKLTREQLVDLRATPARSLKNRVRLAIDLLGTTQSEVAELTGVNASTLSQIVNGRHGDVMVETARRLAEHFGCAIEDLFPRQQSEVA